MPLRLAFMGTPGFAVPTLLEITGQHEIVAVYTRAPRPAGRGMAPQQSPIAREAARRGIPIFTPKTLKDPAAVAAIGELNADAAVVVAYGLILPKAVLDVFPLGCFNVHASLLPRWRGAAPIQRAIMAGDNDTGVMVMKMEESLDTGPIAMADRVPIGSDMTAGELHDELAQRGARLATVALAALERDSPQLTPQSNEGVTYANKIEKSETRIDWAKPWSEVHNHIRGLSPFPGAWFEAADIGRVKVLRSTRGEGSGQPGQILDDRLTIACGEGSVRLLEVQRAGKQPMRAEDFLRGTPIGRDRVLS
ncbi:MAG TPA: methionyl-tRNA formyltransferase [Xanthobacteraceae bacterium]|nr:methionyl-tRNA formyltransferase [Xanthobacteraceae bacterium]